jgi:hypothetical protein
MSDVAFLEEESQEQTASNVLKDIREKATKLAELRVDMDLAEEAYKQAKKDYDTYRCVTLPNIMKMHDIDMVRLSSGAVIEVLKKYYCSPNKNDEDRQAIYEWLEENNGSDLIKKEIKVDPDNQKKLVEAQIPFSLDKNVNTNSLKAWLKDQVGGNTGVAIIDINDIPKCVHFIVQDECEINIK